MTVYLVQDSSTGEYVKNAAGTLRSKHPDEAYEFASPEAAREMATRPTDTTCPMAVEE